MYILVHVEGGCIQTVRGFNTVSAAVAHIDPDDTDDPEGDDIAVYKTDPSLREDGVLVARWYPGYDERTKEGCCWTYFEGSPVIAPYEHDAEVRRELEEAQERGATLSEKLLRIQKITKEE